MANARPPAPQPDATRPSRSAGVARPITLGDMLWYSLPGAGVSFLYTLIVVMYLKYTTDVLLVSSAAVGMLMLACKVWDAVSDPLAGFLSDRTRSRLGRRKSWLLGCSLPLAAFAVMMWLPPAGLSEGATLAWIAVAVFGFYTAYTGFEVPHLSLGAELTFDAVARNRVFGVRTLVKTAGGMILTFAIGVPLLDSQNARSHAEPLLWTVAVVTAVSLWLCVWKVPPERADYTGRGPENPLRALRDVWRNARARNVLIMYFIEAMGLGGIGVLVPFAVEYVLEMPGRSALFLAAYALAQIAGIPVWVKLGDRFEKQHLWMFAMGQSLVGFGLMLFLTAGNWLLLLVSSLIAGSAGGCAQTIGVSLKADIIDVDEYETGERKEGSYFAAWSFSNKLAGGLMVGVVGVALEWIGFRPNEVQDESVRDWMLFLMGGVPVIGFGLGMALFSRFDLRHAEHVRIRAAIDARRDAS